MDHVFKQKKMQPNFNWKLYNSSWFRIFEKYWIINGRFLNWNETAPVQISKKQDAEETHWESCVSWVWSVYKKHHVICVSLQFRGYSLQTSTPKEKQPTSGCGPHLLALSSSSPFDKAAACGHQSSVCAIHVCIWNRNREKGPKEKENSGATLQIHRWTIFSSSGPPGRRCGSG